MTKKKKKIKKLQAHEAAIDYHGGELQCFIVQRNHFMMGDKFLGLVDTGF